MALSTLAGVVDTRILGRPERFDGEDANWYDFKFEFENYMGAVNNTVVEMMEVAAKQQDAIPMDVMTSEQKAVSQQLFYVMAMLVRGTARRVVRKIKLKNGMEAWRQLVRRYEVEDEGRFTGMFQSILDLELPKKLEEIEEAIMDWEQEIKDYEEQTNQTVADHLMRGILQKQLPEELKLQVQLQSSILNTYDKTKKFLTDYLMAKKVWSKKKTKDDMDVDAIGWKDYGGKNPWGKQGKGGKGK